ncbi:MAG: T9SS type A sorting domain-containing protein [Janthinobacterium lividum]
MKHKYLLTALLLAALGQQAQAQTTAWRPFRPNFVYGFAQTGATAATVHTLRVDSAYATASGDSVYAFNRLLRSSSTAIYNYFKSRNNLLGARLRWQPGTSDYYLEANAEPAPNGPATPVALRLRPRAAVGSTWSASTVPALTATLSSRTLGSVGNNVPDSLATITLSNGQVLVLSRQHGLVSGPPWLTLSTGTTAPPAAWQQAELPQAGLGSYDPRVIFALNVGDEVGYELGDVAMFSPACYTGYGLRRIVARQLTADSLILTYRSQDRITNTTWCGSTTVLNPIYQHRWAFSLRTGNSPQFPYMGLLAGEYRIAYANPMALYMGQGYQAAANNSACITGTQTQPFLEVHGVGPYYQPGIDAGYRDYALASGLGAGLYQTTSLDYTRLVYYRKGGVSCGQAANFATLLPSRAAQSADAATLHPNPATDAATLSLVTPTQPGSVLQLIDALGRRVQSTELAPGQTILSIPLASQSTGLYLVQLLAPGAAPLTWKLHKQ